MKIVVKATREDTVGVVRGRDWWRCRRAWRSCSAPSSTKWALHALFWEGRWPGYRSGTSYARVSAPVSFLIESPRRPHSRHAPSVAYTLTFSSYPAVVAHHARRGLNIPARRGSGQRHRPGGRRQEPRARAHLRPERAPGSQGRCRWQRQGQAEARWR